MNLDDHSMQGTRYRAPNALCTLIVATCDRSALLLDCLHSIPSQERPHVRIVVIDQNETPFLETDLARLAAEMDLEHLHVSFRNASRARNFGATHSTTAWLAFPDDDCRFLPDTLTIAREFMTRGNLDMLAGQVVDANGRPPHHRLVLNRDRPPARRLRTLLRRKYLLYPQAGLRSH